MYHEATACNVTTDIIEVINLMNTIIECCNSHSSNCKFSTQHII